MIWGDLTAYFHLLEREVSDAWPPEWGHLHGERLRETVLNEELRLRRVVDRAIRQKILHAKPQPLASLDAWFTSQRIVIAHCACREYARTGEKIPSLITEPQLRAHMLVNFWNEIGADMVRDQWRQLTPTQDSSVWKFRHALAGSEPCSSRSSKS